MIKRGSWAVFALAALLSAGLYVGSIRAQTMPSQASSAWAQWQGKQVSLKLEDGGKYFGQLINPIMLDGDTYLHLQNPVEGPIMINTRKILTVQGIP